jgi:hypothetical protein
MTQSAVQNENGHVDASTTTVVEKVDHLPSWLDSESTMNGASHTAPSLAEPAWSNPSQPTDESAESFSLISEDDLPEWLRALGDQEFEPEEQSVISAPIRSMSALPVSSVAPTISRAWLSRPRDAQSESTEELASDFSPLESGPTAGLKSQPTPKRQTDELTPLEEDKQVVAVADEPSVAPAAPENQRVRLLVLSIVILLVVILGYFAVTNFL